jgi:flagellar hook-associated protein 1 FlgK
VSVFVAGSQPLVLGSKAATLSIDDPADFGAGSGKKVLNFQQPGSSTKVELNESMLGGGQVAGLLRFQNNDLAEGRNLLGRMAVAISETMNTQNRLGLTLSGQPGENLFAPISLGNAVRSSFNASTATMALTVTNPAALQASSYTISFTSATTGSVTRHSDGKVFSFDDSAPATAMATVFSAQGLSVAPSLPPNAPVAGDQFMINALQGTAAELKALQYSPADLAAANPINAAMGTNNSGTLQMVSLRALTNPPGVAAPVTITFTGPNSYTRSDDPAIPPALPTVYGYTSGQPISFDTATPPTGWSVTLNGAPKAGDTLTIDNALAPAYGDWYQRDAGNASALMGLRDVPMFDGATLADGFASAMAQIGTRTQSAQFAAELSSAIATNLERDRTAVSGVNLDEEAARLIQFQQAYQASAKMLQIAQSIFDTLIQGLGR